MATTPEGKVKAKCSKQLKALGIYFFYPATGGYGKSGVPDIVGCYESYFIGIECKAGKGKPTALQLKNLREINAAGGLAIIINEQNVDDLTTILTAWLCQLRSKEL